MPVIDTTTKQCGWCKTIERVFACPCCNKTTCRECLVYYDEEGNCTHAKVEPSTSKTWEPTDKLFYPLSDALDAVPPYLLMWEIGVEGDKFNPHELNEHCPSARCLPLSFDEAEFYVAKLESTKQRPSYEEWQEFWRTHGEQKA